jgi:dTDP-4-amino-4,6-dideoxygalactose transaminase
MKVKVPLLRPYFDSEELEEVKKVLDSGWITQGPKVKEFVDLKTYNMNPDLIEEKITERTKVITPVHTFGQPAEMDKIMGVAENHNLKVIEDTACALGAIYKNTYAGIIGNIGCFSFHARKGITTGEGGMVDYEARGWLGGFVRISGQLA